MEYILKSDVISGSYSRFRVFRDSIGELNDLKLSLKLGEQVDTKPFRVYHNHPFYPSYRHLTNIYRYLKHIRLSGHIEIIDYRFECLLKKIVTLSRIIRNLIQQLNKQKVEWQGSRSKYLLSSICKTIESFISDFSAYADKYPEYNDCLIRIHKDLIKVRSSINTNFSIEPENSLN